MKAIVIKTMMFCVIGFSGSAVGQAQEFSFAKLGGQMHAEAAYCGGYSAAQLENMKQQQKKQYVGLGMKPAQFDLEFQQGYTERTASLSKTPREKLTQHCEKLKKMANLK